MSQTQRVDSQALGDTLRRAREQQNLSLSEMSRRLGYSKGHLSLVERGKATPSPQLLNSYADRLGIPLSALMADALLRQSPGPVSPDGHNASGFTASELIDTMRVGVDNHSGTELGPDPSVLEDFDRVITENAAIRGQHAIFRMAIGLLQKAASSSPSSDREILVNIHPRVHLSEANPRLLDEWVSMLQAVLKQGWDVSQFYNLDSISGDHHLRWVSRFLRLVGFSGRYRPYATRPSQESLTSYGAIVVPDVGGLLFIPTEWRESYGAAYIVKSGELLEILRDHLRLVRVHCQPVLRTFVLDQAPSPQMHSNPPPDLLRFDFEYTRVESQPGDRFLVKDGLSTLTLPEFLYQKWANDLVSVRGEQSRDWIDTLVENRAQRVSSFRTHIDRFSYRDICTKRAIRQLVEDGEYPADDWLRAPKVPDGGFQPGVSFQEAPSTPMERIQHLQEVISRLRAFPNYELGLADDSIADQIAESFWWVKGDGESSSVFLDTWFAQGEVHKELRIQINNATVSQAFRSYFADMWESLPRENRDKARVIDYLQEQIEEVPKE